LCVLDAHSNLFVKEQAPIAAAAGFKGKEMLAHISKKWARRKAGVPETPLLMLTDQSDSALDKLVESLQDVPMDSIKRALVAHGKEITVNSKPELCRLLATTMLS